MVIRKKGQVVIFFILALVVLFSMFFMYYVVSQSSGQETERSLKQIESENVIRDRVYDDVQSCFNQASASAIKVLGENAGFIPSGKGVYAYRTPYDPPNDKFNLTGNIVKDDTSGNFLDYYGEKIVILIKDNPLKYSEEYYPCMEDVDCSSYTLGIEKPAISVFKHLPNPIYFCKKNIPEGCKVVGGLSCDCHCYEGILADGTINNETTEGSWCYNSAQASTERYIKNYFFQCINTLREDLQGYVLHPDSLDNVSIDSYFAKTNVEFFVESDVYLTSSTTSTKIEFPKVNSNSYDIGLNAFYEPPPNKDFDFKDIIAAESLIANHNLEQSLSTYFGDYGGMVFEEYFDNTNDKIYDIIRVNLTADEVYSLSDDGRLLYSGGINGEPFEFIFARENRRPAMEEIKSHNITCNEDTGFCDVKFKVADPDEDLFSSGYGNTLKVYVGTSLYSGTVQEIGDHTYKVTIAIDTGDFSVCDGLMGRPETLCDTQDLSVPIADTI